MDCLGFNDCKKIVGWVALRYTQPTPTSNALFCVDSPLREFQKSNTSPILKNVASPILRILFAKYLFY